MCGIAGILTMDLDFGGDEVVSRMLDCLYHRGPDEGGRRTFQIFVEGGWCASLFLGHRRLSIIDLENGRQPMGDLEGRVWVSYNGEIYNFPELREELIREGWRFRTRS
ncbi:MAG: asparagine synthetase B, partial [Planctomycetota bacterium]